MKNKLSILDIFEGVVKKNPNRQDMIDYSVVLGSVNAPGDSKIRRKSKTKKVDYSKIKNRSKKK